MSHSEARASAVSFFVVLLFASPAYGAPENISCSEKGPPSSAFLTIAYGGGAKGLLTITAPFGQADLPATREVRKGGDGFDFTAIRAFGRATVLMPDQSAMVRCISERGDADDCSDKIPDSAPEVPVTIEVRISIVDAPNAHVEIVRTYSEPSQMLGRSIGVSTFPARCTIVRSTAP